MVNQNAYALGANRSCIRDLFEYGRKRAAIVGPENVYDYSLGNPSIPAPAEVNEAVHRILEETDSLLVHGYTSAVGDYDARKAISDDLNARYGAPPGPRNSSLAAARPRSWCPFSGRWQYPAESCWRWLPTSRSTSPLPRKRG